MKIAALIGITVSMICQISVWAKIPQPNDTALVQFEVTANLLRAVIDSSESFNKQCKIPTKKATQMMMPLAARRDLSLAEAVKKLLRSSSPASAWMKMAKSCESRCVCGLFVDLAQVIVTKKWDTKSMARLDFVKKFAQGMTTAQAVQCAQREVRICDGKLFKALLKEAK